MITKKFVIDAEKYSIVNFVMEQPKNFNISKFLGQPFYYYGVPKKVRLFYSESEKEVRV